MPVLKRRSSKNKKSYKSKSLRRIRGGFSAAEHAIATFGGPGQQSAAAGSNVIAMKDVDIVALAPKTTGGKGKKFRGGATGATDASGSVINPATAAAAAATGLASAFSSMINPAPVPEAAPSVETAHETTVTDVEKEQNVDDALTQEPVAVIPTGDAVVSTTEIPQDHMDGMGNSITGGSILTEVAVPAILLYANQTIKPKSRKFMPKEKRARFSSKRPRK
jgi:hypothetical protein